jgi:hypothetical protein
MELLLHETASINAEKFNKLVRDRSEADPKSMWRTCGISYGKLFGLILDGCQSEGLKRMESHRKYWIADQFIPEFAKWNDNSGSPAAKIDDTPCAYDVAQAFSHASYTFFKADNEEGMILDVQGSSCNDGPFTFTDPQVVHRTIYFSRTLEFTYSRRLSMQGKQRKITSVISVKAIWAN